MEILHLNHHQIPFEFKRSKRARRMTLKIVAEESKVVLVVPQSTFRFQANAFLKKQLGWIEKQWVHMEEALAKRPTLEHTEAYYKNKAKMIIRERLKFFNAHYQFNYNRVFFRNQRTRWGSCSSNRNLNFNWRLILAPLEVLDYVVVHELCHLERMDHSKPFWELVEEQIPDYKKRRQWLKDNHYLLTFNQNY